jgi:hypothetical protein
MQTTSKPTKIAIWCDPSKPTKVKVTRKEEFYTNDSTETILEKLLPKGVQCDVSYRQRKSNRSSES